MFMDIGKFSENIEKTDRILRRRMFSGLIVILSIAFAVITNNAYETKSLIEHIKNPIVSISFLLGIYLIGIIVEIFSELIVSRIIGGISWAALFPSREIPAKSKATCFILRGLALYFIVPFLVLYHGARGLFGKCNYIEDLNGLETTLAREKFQALPQILKIGLTHPFGNYFETAWQLACQELDEKKELIILRLFSTAKDILTIITSLLLAIFIVLFQVEIDLIFLQKYWWLIPVTVLLPSLLSVAYTQILKSAIFNCIEVLSLKKTN